MKKLSILVVLLAIGGAAYMWWPELSTFFGPASVDESPRLMSIEDYVRINISELSPEKEVLGGKFYVTEITADRGQGTVSYEDGHIALTADFTYTTDPDRGHAITSFVIR